MSGRNPDRSFALFPQTGLAAEIRSFIIDAENEMEDPSLPAANPNMPKELQRWEKIRRKGKARFILLTGVLAWGIPMFLLMTFVVNRKPWHTRMPGEIAGPAVLWTLGGAGFGWWVWRSSEKKYLNHIETRDEADDD